jgi:hypothetical protein
MKGLRIGRMILIQGCNREGFRKRFGTIKILMALGMQNPLRLKRYVTSVRSIRLPIGIILSAQYYFVGIA